MDGFKDEDGCPEPDNDRDGIPDAQDKCPNEAEILNGFKDEDGCPDKGKPIVTPDLEILQKVFFDTGKATIKKKSFPLLNAVALTLKANPEIKKVKVEGHTDDVGNDKANLKLSQDRAASVRNYLISKGIKPSILISEGFGESRPAVKIEGLRGGKLKAARSDNRRVQFVVLERDKRKP